MKNEIKLIVSDIDGTILDSHHRLDAKLQEVVMLLKEQNIPLVLASARSPKGIVPLVKDLDMLEFPLVAYNGALIGYLEDEVFQVLSEQTISGYELCRILDLLKKYFPTISVNLYSGMDWLVATADQWVKSEATITGETPYVCQLEEFVKKSPSVHKLLLIGDEAEIVSCFAFLQEQSFLETSFYLSKSNYLEVTHKEVSKEQALHFLTDYYGLFLEQVMAVGDNFNDLPMLKAAGLGIAMGNAPEEVISQVDTKTLSNDYHGVSTAIEKYVLLKIEN